MGEQLTGPACYVINLLINLDDSNGPGSHWVAAQIRIVNLAPATEFVS